MSTYSFLSVNASLIGPGGSINLAAGAGNAEEGITIEPTESIDTMTIGADGTAMHSLHANRSGKVTVRLLKTSPVNKQLAQMYALQTASPANHGQNTISVVDSNLQDVISCLVVAFERAPNLTYAKEGGLNEWTFNAGVINRALGDNA